MELVGQTIETEASEEEREMGRWKEEEEQEEEVTVGVEVDDLIAGLGRHIQNAASPTLFPIWQIYRNTGQFVDV